MLPANNTNTITNFPYTLTNKTDTVTNCTNYSTNQQPDHPRTHKGAVDWLSRMRRVSVGDLDMYTRLAKKNQKGISQPPTRNDKYSQYAVYTLFCHMYRRNIIIEARCDDVTKEICTMYPSCSREQC